LRRNSSNAGDSDRFIHTFHPSESNGIFKGDLKTGRTFHSSLRIRSRKNSSNSGDINQPDSGRFIHRYHPSGRNAGVAGYPCSNVQMNRWRRNGFLPNGNLGLGVIYPNESRDSNHFPPHLDGFSPNRNVDSNSAYPNGTVDSKCLHQNGDLDPNGYFPDRNRKLNGFSYDGNLESHFPCPVRTRKLLGDQILGFHTHVLKRNNVSDGIGPSECGFDHDPEQLAKKLEFVKLHLRRWGYPEWAPIFSLANGALQSRPLLLAMAWFLAYFDVFETTLLRRIEPLLKLSAGAPLPPYPRDVSTTSEAIKLGRDAEGEVRAMVSRVLRSLDSVDDPVIRASARAQQVLMMYGKVRFCMKSLRALKVSKVRLINELEDVQKSTDGKMVWHRDHKRPLTQYEVSLLQCPDALISHFDALRSQQMMREKIDESRAHEALFQEWMESVLEMGVSDIWVMKDGEFVVDDDSIHHQRVIDQLLPGKVKQQQRKASPCSNAKNERLSSAEVELILKDMDADELSFCVQSVNNKLPAISDNPTAKSTAQMAQRFFLFLFHHLFSPVFTLVFQSSFIFDRLR
jgi:hypothetical protein